MQTRLRSCSVRRAVLAALFLGLAGPVAGQELELPNKGGSVKFAIIGDTGTGSGAQSEVGRQMAAFHALFPFELVLMVGDNIYGADGPNDYRTKFELPYKALLDGGVKFYASLGNHDNPNQRSYKQYNMNGQRYYTFRGSPGGVGKVLSGGVRFFAIDSNYLDKPQIDWLEKELAASGSDWKIAFFHHPLYSSGKTHGSALDLRAVLEPLFVKYGVNVVFAGHDHIYERIKPQKGIYHFVTGAGGSLRKGDLRRAEFTEVGYDQDYHFMLAEIDGDDLHFQAISRTGATIDSGVIHRPKSPDTVATLAPPQPVPAAPVPASPGPPPSPMPKPSPGDPVSPAPGKAGTPPGVASPSPKPSPSTSPSPKPRAKPKKRKRTG